MLINLSFLDELIFFFEIMFSEIIVMIIRSKLFIIQSAISMTYCTKITDWIKKLKFGSIFLWNFFFLANKIKT